MEKLGISNNIKDNDIELLAIGVKSLIESLAGNMLTRSFTTTAASIFPIIKF